jgi:hypothetical protein
MKGHGVGPCPPCGIHDEIYNGTNGWNGRKVWFKPLNGEVEEVEIQGAYISNPLDCCPGQPDFTIVYFKAPLPDSIETMRVMTLPAGSGPFTPYRIGIRTCQHLRVNANFPGFDNHDSAYLGDSGSPNMILIPGNELIFYQGTATAGISTAIQNAMNDLSSHFRHSPYPLDCYSPCGAGCYVPCP